MNIYNVPAGFDGYIERINLEGIESEIILINGINLLKSKIYKLMEIKKKIKNLGKTLMVDSGGFQLATESSDYINAKEIIDLQNKIADIGFILDKPPLKKGIGTGAASLSVSLSDNFFKKCMNETKDNILSVKDIRKQFEYYFINQGITYNQLNLWFDELYHLDSFDGIATKATTTEQLLLGLLFVSTKQNIKKHHILGIGSFFGMVIINYFYQKESKEMDRVTFDSTTALVHSSGKRLILPFTSKPFPIGSYGEHDGRIYEYSIKELKKSPEKFLILNCNINEFQHQILYSLSKNTEVYKEYFSDNRYKNIFNIIDYFYSSGKNIIETIIKYEQFFKTRTSKNDTIQNSLMRKY